MRNVLLLFFVSIAIPVLADVEVLRTLPLDQQEAVAKGEKDSGQKKITEAMLTNAAVEMEQECMKAVANADFCRCIARETPASVNFLSYVAMVTGTREQSGYASLSMQDRLTYDATRKARDACVSWKGKR